MATKYLIVKVRGCEVPIAFPDVLQHNEIKVVVDGVECPIVSAGFCSLTPRECYVSGNSISLNKEFRPDDKNLLDKLLTK